MPLAPAAPSNDLSRSARVTWLLAIVALGTALRAYRIDWGLPKFIFFDSLVHFVQPAAAILVEGDLAPRVFVHPPATTYVLAALGALWSAVHGKTPGSADLELLGRALMTAESAATIVLLYLLARRLIGTRGALLASAAFALSPLHVLEAHRTHADAGMLLLALASAHQAVVARDGGSLRRLYLAFALAGLSGAVKYTGLTSGSVAAWLALTWQGATPRKRVRMALVGAAISALAFALAVSPLLVRWRKFVGTLGLLAHVGVFVGQPGQNLQGDAWFYAPWIHPLVAALPYGVGWAVYLAGLAGLALLAGSRRARGPVFAAVVPFFALQGAAETPVPRYFLPLLPWVCLGAGHAIASVWRRSAAAGRGVAALVLGYTLVLTVSQCLRIGGPADVVAERLGAQIVATPVGRRPLVLGYGNRLLLHYDPLAPFLRAARLELAYYPRIAARDAPSEDAVRERYRAWLDEERVDLVLVTSRLESTVAREPGRPEEMLLAGLEDGSFGFRRVAGVHTRFFTQSLYTWADPSLDTHLTAGILGYDLYAREAAPSPSGAR